jgi:hypothetical protein
VGDQRSQQLMDAVAHLEDLEDISTLTELLSPP